jgi:hypothetical protein
MTNFPVLPRTRDLQGPTSGFKRGSEIEENRQEEVKEITALIANCPAPSL